MEIKIAFILGAQCVVLAAFGWLFFRRRRMATNRAPDAQQPSDVGAIDRRQAWRLLSSIQKALSDHLDAIGGFEHSLRTADPAVDAGAFRQSNQCVEHAVESSVAALLAACGDLLSEEQASLNSYRQKTIAIDAALDEVDRDDVVKIASTLLGMVCDLKAENKAVQEEVTASHEKIVHLLSRVNAAEQTARVDVLTQLPNRRAFDEAYSRCEETLDRNGRAFSVVLLDVDHFKNVNDSYGHAAGDAALSLLAQLLRENCRALDTPCRLGGEEFAVLLPGCDENVATAIAEKHRKGIRDTVLRFGEHTVRITVSCGVVEATSGESQSQVMKRVDVALYEAKNRGRNQTIASQARLGRYTIHASTQA